MPGLSRKRQRDFDIWPGFVDVLSTLLIITMFALMVFVLAQFFLAQALTGREAALARLNQQLAEMADMLALERSSNEDLRLSLAQVSGQLREANARVDGLQARLRDADAATFENEQLRDRLASVAKLEQDVAALRALRDELEAKIRAQGAQLAERDGQLAEDRRLSEEARAQAALINAQMEELRKQLAALQAALDASEERGKTQEVTIADLGKKLNAALAEKVQELRRYRSEFFGRLREVLGTREDVRIVGDRFVFQSEVLFPSGSNILQPQGQETLARLAQTLMQIARTIPPDIDWILRVDGHTDRRPINTAQFQSNWELSASRAISVVNFLISQGVPPHRLAAAGFGEYQPIDPGADDAALARNRRIELKLDQR
ncbi:peptidoglycan -binding protein [Pararhodospirillum photometricum]|uniref:OmpA/MotB n=1 Tax=Pararhodospirillum photometricum DSM 122 TaxID=1150469 RepID=H6SRM6_PARPM|nr:peptidoglycan -binding protein [Pararhodospirillum photometricum]CCG07555.1 OmpA/MotB [Pararhodospirillum photometricum DSM 122]